MMKSRVLSFVKQYPTAIFFILTYILSWGFGYLTDLIYESTNSIILTLPIAVLSAGPLLAALIVSAIIGGKTEVVTLVRKLFIWRVSWYWYAVALFLLPTLALLSIYLNVLLGAPMPTLASYGPFTGLLGAFAIRLVNPWDGPMLEELGWRGFALPRLQDRYTPLTANLILAVLVTIWHLPLIRSGNYAWIYIPGTMAVTILFGWVFNGTGGSVLLTLIMHATEPLLWVSFDAADEQRAMVLRVLVYVLTAVIVVLFTGKNLGLKPTPENIPDTLQLAPSDV